MNTIGKNTIAGELLRGFVDHAIKLMGWPLLKATEIIADAPAQPMPAADNVVSIVGRG